MPFIFFKDISCSEWNQENQVVTFLIHRHSKDALQDHNTNPLINQMFSVVKCNTLSLDLLDSEDVDYCNDLKCLDGRVETNTALSSLISVLTKLTDHMTLL